jgi:hypothetical protein
MTINGPRKFGFGGVQQFILDMHFILHCFKTEIPAEGNVIANQVCEKALKTYMSSSKDLATPLKVFF